jgi:hypothetical protein
MPFYIILTALSGATPAFCLLYRIDLYSSHIYIGSFKGIGQVYIHCNHLWVIYIDYLCASNRLSRNCLPMPI